MNTGALTKSHASPDLPYPRTFGQQAEVVSYADWIGPRSRRSVTAAMGPIAAISLKSYPVGVAFPEEIDQIIDAR